MGLFLVLPVVVGTCVPLRVVVSLSGLLRGVASVCVLLGVLMVLFLLLAVVVDASVLLRVVFSVAGR